MAKKVTAAQKAAAKKHGIRTTKTIRGKRVDVDSETLKKRVEAVKAKKAKAKITAKKRAASTRTIGSSDRATDSKIKASTVAGSRRSKKTSIIEYKVKDPKTGKLVVKKVRRKNANQFVSAGDAGGKLYTERRANRTDKGKYI